MARYDEESKSNATSQVASSAAGAAAAAAATYAAANSGSDQSDIHIGDESNTTTKKSVPTGGAASAAVTAVNASKKQRKSGKKRKRNKNREEYYKELVEQAWKNKEILDSEVFWNECGVAEDKRVFTLPQDKADLGRKRQIKANEHNAVKMALVVAVVSGNTEMAKAILKCFKGTELGFNITITTISRTNFMTNSLLGQAINNKDVEMVKILLESGAPLNFIGTAKKSKTALGLVFTRIFGNQSNEEERNKIKLLEEFVKLLGKHGYTYEMAMKDFEDRPCYAVQAAGVVRKYLKKKGVKNTSSSSASAAAAAAAAAAAETQAPANQASVSNSDGSLPPAKKAKKNPEAQEASGNGEAGAATRQATGATSAAITAALAKLEVEKAKELSVKVGRTYLAEYEMSDSTTSRAGERGELMKFLKKKPAVTADINTLLKLSVNTNPAIAAAAAARAAKGQETNTTSLAAEAAAQAAAADVDVATTALVSRRSQGGGASAERQ